MPCFGRGKRKKKGGGGGVEIHSQQLITTSGSNANKQQQQKQMSAKKKKKESPAVAAKTDEHCAIPCAQEKSMAELTVSINEVLLVFSGGSGARAPALLARVLLQARPGGVRVNTHTALQLGQ